MNAVAWAKKRGRVLLLAVLLCALGGCNDAGVAYDLTQAQATEIVATLNQSGISATAERESGGRGKYSVSVKRSRYADAVQVLHERGLPSEARPSFGELIQSRGLVPDSREVEALRLDRALAAEIEEALEINPAIASARVIVRLNSLPLEMSGDNSQAGVSVSLRVRTGAEIAEGDVRETIARAIPGIDPARVHLSMHPAEVAAQGSETEGVVRTSEGQVARVPLTDFLWVWRVPETDYNSLALGVLLGILVIFGLGAVVGASLTNYRRARGAPGESGGGLSPARRLPQPVREPRVRSELPDGTAGDGER